MIFILQHIGEIKMAYFISEDCIGCTLCAKSCPVQAIEGTVKQRHVINPKRCVECGVCGNVCNKAAVLTFSGEVAPKLPKAEWKKPLIDAQLCSACAICVNVCGRDSLEISLPQFKGDIHVFAYLANEKSCVGCGLCASYCPLHAITMKAGEGA